MFGLSMIELILYLALVVAAVFLVVILIISAVFAKRHRDLDADPLAGYNVEVPADWQVRAAEAQTAQAPVQYAAAQAALALGIFPEDELFFVHLVTQPGVQVVELFFKLQVALFNLAPPRVELCQQLAAGPMLGAVGLE